MRRFSVMLAALALAGLPSVAEARFGDRVREKRAARKTGQCAAPVAATPFAARPLPIAQAVVPALATGDCAGGSCSPGANGVRGRFFGR